MQTTVEQADKIKRPLLLIHGEEDNNTGEALAATILGQTSIPAAVISDVHRLSQMFDCPGDDVDCTYCIRSSTFPAQRGLSYNKCITLLSILTQAR